MINIGLLGLGTVGKGVVEILNKRQKELEDLTGRKVRVKKILVKNVDKDRGMDLEEGVITGDFEEILNDQDISIIVEVTSDLEESYTYIKKSLSAGKHVVTANKAVVSKYFEELSQLAADKDLAFLYEASVGGGIPVLKPLKEELALNKGIMIQGILNGTCNYILTRMVNEGKDYEEILKIAQDLGYAEADPTADVEGEDTLRKLRILATLVLQGRITEEDILSYGISSITSWDIENIKNMDSTIKLIGEARLTDEGYIALVHPTIIRNDSQFANVDMAFNSIIFRGENVGELKFYGPGAGKLPTANAVLRDVLDIINDSYWKGNPLGTNKLKNANHTFRSRYYIRISGSDKEVLELFQDALDDIISEEGNIAITTKEVLYKEILDRIQSLGIDRDQYFIARIMD